MLTPTRTLDSVHVGDPLPELVVELTPTLIIASAIATRDYQDVHHDPALARQRGAPAIFMNILSTNGFVARLVTDWAGPEAVVRGISIRLGVPNFAGDRMLLSGRVSAAGVRDGVPVVEVEVSGSNGLGEHVSGTVAVALPAAG